MTLVWSCKRFHIEYISTNPLWSSPFSKSSHDKPLVNFLIIDLIIGFFEFFVAKYTKEHLQTIFKMVLKAQTLFSDKYYEKLLKARLPNIYYSKSYIKYYNFCQ